MSPPTESEVEQARKVILAHARDVVDDINGSPGTFDGILSAQSDFAKPSYEHMFSGAFGSIWDREGLERKYRSLTVISILAATEKTSQLKSHVKLGLHNGLTEVEIREALLHVMGYCGYPTGLNAINIASEVIEEAKKQ